MNSGLHDPTIALIAFICMTVAVVLVLAGGVLLSSHVGTPWRHRHRHP